MKAIIFDFNGTMVFDGIYHDQAWKAFSKRIRGFELSDDELNHKIHGTVNEKIIEYLKPGVCKEENKQLSLEKEALYREMCVQDKENYKMVNGLKEYLDYLKAKEIPFTIASASIKENMDFFVEVFELEKWIKKEMIVYNDETHIDKKSMFLEAASRLGVDIKDCIIFEDSFTGVKCAKEIGCKKIIAIPLDKYRKEFENIDEVIFTIKDYTDQRLMEVI